MGHDCSTGSGISNRDLTWLLGFSRDNVSHGLENFTSAYLLFYSVTGIVRLLEDANNPLFVTHQHADRDTLGAAFGLQAVLDRGTVCTPDGIAKSARPLVQATNADPITGVETEAYDRIVVLDAPSTDRIAPIDPDEPILIDHHEPGDLSDQASAAHVDTDADATAVLVARLAIDANWELSSDVALPLLVGIFNDTENLTDASAETVRLAGQLMEELGDSVSVFSDLIAPSPDSSKQIAQTLGTLRANGHRAGDWFIAFSEVGGHETAAARGLRESGVDLVAIFSERSHGYRVTVRASDALSESISLGEFLLPELAREFGGDGGGHDGAGVAALRTDNREAVEQHVLRQVEKRLGTSFNHIS